MNKQWRQVLPPRWLIVAALAIYLSTYIIDLYVVRLGLPIPEEIGRIRAGILSLLAAAYGFYRVAAFHPSYDKGYAQWLCLSPWSIDKPLPKGPVHLIWIDLVIVAILTALARFNVPFFVFVPFVAFLGLYVVMMFLGLQGEQDGLIALFLFIAPFGFYPFANWYMLVLVLIVLYILCYIGFYRIGKEFPWNTKYWKADIVEEFKKEAIQMKVLGWPFKSLNVHTTFEMPSLGSLILSLLLTWWLHTICWLFDKPYELDLIGAIAFFLAFIRLLVYTTFLRPPISLMGRVFTGHLIIPRYDQVYIAPICILLAGIGLPFALHYCGLPTVWNFEICFFLVFLLAFSLPPTLKKWKLTGAYQFGRNAQSIRPRVPSPQDQAVTEFFTSKFKTE